MKTVTFTATIVLCSCIVASCDRNSNTTPPTEQNRIARETPSPISPLEREVVNYLQTLSESYWLKDGDSWFTRFQLTDRRDILYLQTKALEYRYTSNEATEADTLNGIEWEGQAVFTIVPTRSYSPEGTMMHWAQHPAGWSVWKDKPFMTPNFQITKINGRWNAKPLEPVPMSKPSALEIHKTTGQFTPEDRKELEAEAALLQAARKPSKEIAKLILRDSFTVSQKPVGEAVLTDTGIHVNQITNGRKTDQTYWFGDITNVGTGYHGNPSFDLHSGEAPLIYSAAGHDADAAFIKKFKDAYSVWCRKHPDLAPK